MMTTATTSLKNEKSVAFPLHIYPDGTSRIGMTKGNWEKENINDKTHKRIHTVNTHTYWERRNKRADT